MSKPTSGYTSNCPWQYGIQLDLDDVLTIDFPLTCHSHVSSEELKDCLQPL